MGLGLAVQSSGENGSWHDDVAHAPGTLTVCSPRAVRTRDDAVACSPVAQWRLAGGKVLPVSTEKAPGRRRTWSWGTTLTGKGSPTMRRLGGGKQRPSVVVRELRWSPVVPEGSCTTGGRREVRRGDRLMTGSSGGFSSSRGDEAAVVAQNSLSMGVLRWSGWDER
jgi:hypothetical protein